MATAAQLIVAGALLLAWIWVLGRPFIGGSAQSDYRNLHRTPADPDVSGAPGVGESFRASRSILRWIRRPAATWRRQLMLATMLASFASFLLAVAFRQSGRFVVLFVLMTAVLVIHLIVASYIGRRMLAADRAVVVAAAKKRVQRPNAMSIRADQVGGQRILSDDGLGSGVGMGGAESASAAFAVAAELASQLAQEQDSSAKETEAIADALEPNEGLENLADAALVGDDGEGDIKGEVDSPAASETDVTADVEEGADDEIDESVDLEPIFRRAAKDEPARGRRQAKAIYIESQLDEEGEGFAIKAANQQ